MNERPFFNEFVVHSTQPAAEVLEAVRARSGILAGCDMARWGMDAHELLVCVTEMNTREQIDRLVDVLGEVLA